MVVFLLLNQRKGEARLALTALRHFCSNRWGKYSPGSPNPLTLSPAAEEPRIAADAFKRVLVIAGGSREETLRLKACVERRFPKARAVLLVADDREDVYLPHFAERCVLESKRFGRFVYTTRVFAKIWFSGFDAAISVDPSPFSFAVKHSYAYVPEDDRLNASDSGYLHLHKVALPVLLSGVVACLVTPIVFLRSFQYGTGYRRSA